jgi:ribose 5-phosphate isomerase A
VSDVSAGTQAALELVEAEQTIGLGTGRAAVAFVHGLGARVREGLSIRGVATSESTAELARGLGIPLLTLAEAGTIDTTFDGADEFDPNLDLIKGYGAALVREKIVAASSEQLVILVGPEKRVATLGERGKLPIEILPFGQTLCERRLRALGCEPTLRISDGGPLVTDNGNYILDCRIAPLTNPHALEEAALEIPGVVGTGLFLGLANVVIVSDGDDVEVLRRR